MLIDEQNKKGGLLGKKLEAVVVDPASNWPLFAEKARELIDQGQGRGRVRLLDLGLPQVRAAGVQGAELDPVLPRAVRGRGKRAQRLLHRRRAEPAGHSRRRLPDERGEGCSAGCSPAPTTSIRARPTRSSRPTSRPRACRAEDIMINYTPFGHSDWQTIVVRHQEVRLGRQEDRRRLDHQRRRQRALLQGTRQPGHQGDGHSGRRLLGRRGRARRHRHQAARRPPRRLELLPVGRHAGEQGVHREVEGLHQERQARDQRPDGSPRHRLQHVGQGGREGRHHRSGQGHRRAARASRRRTSPAASPRCCRTTTSPSRC